MNLLAFDFIKISTYLVIATSAAAATVTAAEESNRFSNPLQKNVLAKQCDINTPFAGRMTVDRESSEQKSN